MKTEQEYLDLIRELNGDVYDKHGEIEDQFFYTSSGFVDIIGFGDIMLWNSENDDREWQEWDNDNGNYEPMKPFILKKLKSYGEELIKLSLI